MSDRELLELAAKAAGLKIHSRNQAERDELIDPATASLWIVNGSTAWNPLTNDGDALRLAVQLQIDIKQYVNHAVAWFGGGYIGTGRIFYDGDPCAATRRAIVLAAAEIGREQPPEPLSIPSQDTP